MEVKDVTGSTTFVVLDSEAHKIIKMPIKQLQENPFEKCKLHKYIEIYFRH